MSVATWGVLGFSCSNTAANDADGLKILKRLHALAACVHIISATAILSAALAEDSSLKRYGVTPDLGNFIDPQPWVLNCYNSTSKILNKTAVSKCSGKDVVEVFTNSHRRQKGALNIAGMAFAFAFWSGIGHVVSYLYLLAESSSNRLQIQWLKERLIDNKLLKEMLPKRAASALMICRWADYLVSAPLMLATLNVIFAATNLSGVILAPLLLFILEYLAFHLEKVDIQINTAGSMGHAVAPGIPWIEMNLLSR